MATIPSYYRSILDLSQLEHGCIDTPRSNFGPYDLFSINTRMVPYMRKHYQDDQVIRFTTTRRGNRMVLTMNIVNGDMELVPMSPDQVSSLETQVESLISEGNEYSLLIPIQPYLPLGDGVVVDSDWLSSFLPYVDVDEKYDPYTDDEGLYVALLDEPDYPTVYSNLINQVIDQLSEMYSEGYIIGLDQDLADRWGFDELDPDYGIYASTWTDTRITNPYNGMAEFIKSRSKGENTVDIDIGYNLVFRHYAAKEVEATFVSNLIRFKSDSLKDTKAKLSRIMKALARARGQVVTSRTSSMEEANMKRLHGEEVGYDSAAYLTLSGPMVSYLSQRKLDPSIIATDVEIAYLEKSKIKTSERLPNERLN